MAKETVVERLAAAEGELRAVREEIEAGMPHRGDAAAFADAQLRAFGSWVLDLLGFEGDDAFDSVGQARSLLVPLIASNRPREAPGPEAGDDADGGFVDIFADEEDAPAL